VETLPPRAAGASLLYEREPRVRDQFIPEGLNGGPLAEPLRVTKRQQGTTTCIELAGEWDLATAPVVSDALAAVFDVRPECLVFDLTRLRFIDSTGLRATIELADRAAAEEVRLVVLIETEPVQRLFSLCGLSDRLPVIAPEPITEPGGQFSTRRV
jgi:anti-sigma B factor antagonist